MLLTWWESLALLSWIGQMESGLISPEWILLSKKINSDSLILVIIKRIKGANGKKNIRKISIPKVFMNTDLTVVKISFSNFLYSRYLFSIPPNWACFIHCRFRKCLWENFFFFSAARAARETSQYSQGDWHPPAATGEYPLCAASQELVRGTPKSHLSSSPYAVLATHSDHMWSWQKVVLKVVSKFVLTLGRLSLG